jgi:hypothetical protein
MMTMSRCFAPAAVNLSTMESPLRSDAARSMWYHPAVSSTTAFAHAANAPPSISRSAVTARAGSGSPSAFTILNGKLLNAVFLLKPAGLARIKAMAAISAAVEAPAGAPSRANIAAISAAAEAPAGAPSLAKIAAIPALSGAEYPAAARRVAISAAIDAPAGAPRRANACRALPIHDIHAR